MTDNRTTELRGKLTELGVEYRGDDASYTFATHWTDSLGRGCSFVEEVYDDESKTMFVSEPSARNITPEQAIAATLDALPDRHPYEQRITGDGSDWGEIMRDAYDGLMASACEACTPEQMRQLADYIRAELGSATLTAEQVREAVEEAKAELLESCEYVGDMWQRKGDVLKAFGKMEQAIADELNAELGSGTCEVEYVGEWMGWHCKSCDTLWQGLQDQKPSYCMRCGKAVKR